jgi:5'-nucleotidase
MTANPTVRPTPVPDWRRIDVVCLDMDGTVLDLRFDNYFWLEVLPQRWGAARGLEFERALAQLRPMFESKRGTLDYYCIDHWSEELGIDIPALKHQLRDRVSWLDGAEGFLDALRARGKRVLLTTNAHPISLRVKNGQTRLGRHFDEMISSHEFGVPKEDARFWPRLAANHGVDVKRTLFVDDSSAVLQAALAAGVAWIYQVLQPDSTQPAHAAVDGIAGVVRLADLGESLCDQLPEVDGPGSPPLGGAPSP